MAGRVSAAEAWIEARTRGAPPALLVRVREHLASVPDHTLGVRLAQAGELALRASIHSGSGREGALDLLAADALITLALLESAERDPEQLGATAQRLRSVAAATT
jgi:hypothetical protein